VLYLNVSDVYRTAKCQHEGRPVQFLAFALQLSWRLINMSTKEKKLLRWIIVYEDE